MLKKYFFCFSAVLLFTLGLTGCATKNEDGNTDSTAILELSREQRAKLQALKQDNVIYFAFDSDAIPNNYISLLEAHADFLRTASKVTIIIEGHTDERGTPEYNIALGERRARSVAQYLLNLGVPAQQISIVSYGEEKPQLFEHNENAWKKNRRAVISY